MDLAPPVPSRVQAVRRFTRFYTRRMGVLEERLLRGPLSLTESRVVFEIAQSPGLTAARLGAELGLDAGHLSRVLRGLQERGLVERRPSSADGRVGILSLTEAGREVFATLDARSQQEVGAMLAGLTEAQQDRLVAGLASAEALLGGERAAAAPYVLRPPRPGDMGWVVHRHGALYAEEYGWDAEFEALVAEIVAGFVRNLDARRERCWIAERDGAVAGAVFLVCADDATAKLRLLYVEPDARGLGIGRRLVAECIRFARDAGYDRMMLWTNDVLTAARRIYVQAGFRLVAQAPHRSFGRDLVGETWERALRP